MIEIVHLLVTCKVFKSNMQLGQMRTYNAIMIFFQHCWQSHLKWEWFHSKHFSCPFRFGIIVSGRYIVSMQAYM